MGAHGDVVQAEDQEFLLDRAPLQGLSVSRVGNYDPEDSFAVPWEDTLVPAPI